MFGQTVSQVAKDDVPRREVLARLAAATGPALQNLQRLTAEPAVDGAVATTANAA
jgi:hypothetical protein